MAEAPKQDEKIPVLINTAGLAHAVGLARSRVSVLFSMGHIPGREVEGGATVFRKEHAIKLLQDDRNPSRAERDKLIPDLVNSEVAASLRGMTRQRLDVLRQTGRIAARAVTPRLVLFRREVAEADELHEAGGEMLLDKKIPDLVDRTTAARLLGIGVETIWIYYRGGQIPGAEYDTGADSKKGESVVFRRSLIEQLARKPDQLGRRPVYDPKIPELVTTGQAGALLGGGREAARFYYQKGSLPGREVEGAPGERRRVVFRKAVVEKFASQR